MSGQDREKWDRRHAGAGQETPPPSTWLVTALATIGPRKPEGRALDLACGGGRNALFLATAGYRVDAVDISRAGLERGRRAAALAGIRVNWIQADLDLGIPLAGPYALVVMLRYLNLPCLAAACTLLAVGGMVVAEVHLDPRGLDRPVAGPGNPAFLATPGSLREALVGLEIVRYEEGVVADGQGRTEALARVVAVRPSGAGQDRFKGGK